MNQQRASSELVRPQPYVVRFGWQRNSWASFATFDDALSFAADLLKTERRRGEERPTVVNIDQEDEETDGLTADQRDACEAMGLEVRRP